MQATDTHQWRAYEEQMKRIVNGVTYNTDTSTRLATSAWDDDGKITETLYQTRGGAFFLHRQTVGQVWNEETRSKEVQTTHSFQPQSPEDAHKWIMTGEVEVFRNPFDDPPEATTEADPGATLYIRVPASLKRAVDDAAKSEDVSGNVWSMRCVERCLKDDNELKSLFGNLIYGFHLMSHSTRYDKMDHYHFHQEMQSMIAAAWKRFEPAAEDSEALRRQIMSFADEQIDEHYESALSNG